MRNVHEAFAPGQGQQHLRPAGHPLLPLPIPRDLLQELPFASLQGILRRFASSHRRLLFSESRTIGSCSSKSNLLNYLRYSPLARQNEAAKRLLALDGVGPITATAVVATVGDATAFHRGRQFAAWLGLVPKQW